MCIEGSIIKVFADVRLVSAACETCHKAALQGHQGIGFCSSVNHISYVQNIFINILVTTSKTHLLQTMFHWLAS